MPRSALKQKAFTMNRLLTKLTNDILLHYEINGFAPRIPHIRNITRDVLERYTNHSKLRNDIGFLFIENPDLNWKIQLSTNEKNKLSGVALDIFKYDKKKFMNLLHNKSYRPVLYTSICNKDINYSHSIETISKQMKMEKITPETSPFPIYFKYLENH